MATRNVNIKDSNVRKQTKDQTSLEDSRSLGDRFVSEGEYERALENYLKAERAALKVNNPMVLSIIQASIANTYVKLGGYEKAESYYKLATATISDEQNRIRRKKRIMPFSSSSLFVMIGFCMLWALSLYLIEQWIYLHSKVWLLPIMEIVNLVFILCICFYFIWMKTTAQYKDNPDLATKMMRMRNNHKIRFLLDAYYEVRHKVSWPTFGEVKNAFIVIIILSAFICLILLGVDALIYRLFLLINGR